MSNVARSQCSLRPGRPEDAPRLHELHTIAVRTLCAPYYDAGVIEGWLEGRNAEGYLPPIERGAIFVAERDLAVVGFGEAAPGSIVAVYVDPQAIRQGIGTAILRRALEMARHGYEGAIRVEATLNASSFYERHGFREIHRTSLKRNRVDVPVVVMEMPANSTVERDARESGARPSAGR